MADIFVDSNAVGLNDGSSFANAFTSLSSVSPSANDRILIADNHSETYPGGSNEPIPPTYTQGNNAFIPVLSVDTSTSVLSLGASITRTNTSRFSDGYAWFGVNFIAGGNDRFQNPSLLNMPTYFRRCTFTKTGDGEQFGAVSEAFWIFDDCTITNNGSGQWFELGSTSRIWMRRCVVDGTAAQRIFDYPIFSASISELVVEDTDFSGASSAIDDLVTLGDANVSLVGRISNCRLPTGMDAFDRTQTGGLRTHGFRVVNSAPGSFTVPQIDLQEYDTYGVTEVDTVRTRTGGASDGETSYSFRMTTDASSQCAPGVVGIRSIPLSVYVESGASRTITINLAHDGVGDGTSGALTSEELWLEGAHPDTANPSFSAGGSFDTLPTPGSPVDLTSNTETWAGTGVGTRQEVSLTFTPNVSGYVNFTINFAPVDTTGVSVNIDPKPVVS